MAEKPRGVTHAVYNHNPGNIKGYSSSGKKLDYLKVLDRLGIKYSKGSAGSDGGFFIKFESHEDGYKAAKAWWPAVRSWATYEGLTLDEALQKYSGHGILNKDGVAAVGYTASDLGSDLDGSKLLSEYTDEELGSVMPLQIKREDNVEYQNLITAGLINEDGSDASSPPTTTTNVDGVPVITPPSQEEIDSYAKFNDWTEIEKGDISDGEVILVGDDYYEYDDGPGYYIPYDIETGKSEDDQVDRGQYTNDGQIGTNPKFLPNNSNNPKYRGNRNSDGSYEYSSIDQIKRHRKQGKLQEGDVIMLDGKEYNFDSEDDVLVTFDEEGEVSGRLNATTGEIVDDEATTENVVPEATTPPVTVAAPEEYPEVDRAMIDEKYTGKGTFTFDDGTTYVGEWKDGQWDGQGTRTYADGENYVGEFKDDQINGQGTYTWSDGSKYVGELVNGNFHGQGTHTLASGDKYVGEYKDGNFHGQGTYTRVSGDIYEGEFKDGKKHGQGKSTAVDGTIEEGEYVDGEYTPPLNTDIRPTITDQIEVQTPTGPRPEIITTEGQDLEPINFETDEETEGGYDPTLDPTSPEYIPPEDPADIANAEEWERIRAEEIAEEERWNALTPAEQAAEEEVAIAREENATRVRNTDGSTTVTYNDGSGEVTTEQTHQPFELNPEGEEVPIGTAERLEAERISGVETSVEQQQIFKNALSSVGDIGSGLLKGGAAVLDSIGGPSAIISYVLGKKGLKEAMKEVKPQQSAELSPMFMQHLRQSRELAKKGFHPDEAKLMQKELDGAYQIGLENAVRGSGGQRATFLAQSGILDSQRSSALLQYAAKDAELQRTNADKYEKLLMFKENFDITQTEKERSEDMAKQVADKQAATEFTSAAFTNLLGGLGGGASSLLNKQMGTPKQFFSGIQQLLTNSGTTGTNE